MSGTYSARIDGVSSCSSPGSGATGCASGISSSFRQRSASGPIATTILGCTIASSSTTRPTQAGSAREGSATGHLTHSVP